VKCPTKYCSLGFGGAAGDREFGGELVAAVLRYRFYCSMLRVGDLLVLWGDRLVAALKSQQSEE